MGGSRAAAPSPQPLSPEAGARGTLEPLSPAAGARGTPKPLSPARERGRGEGAAAEQVLSLRLLVLLDILWFALGAVLPDRSDRPFAARPGFQALHRALFHARIIERAIHQSAAAIDDALARQRDEMHGLDIARLKAHRRPCGQIEPHAVGGGAIEHQRLVHLEEVK